jgi:hypothetical protein
MSAMATGPTHKPRPPGLRQCPRCHRDLWEPCLQCRQTGLQRPGIVWCPECRQPGRGERCSKCGTKLHAPPACTRCGGLGWLPAHQVCVFQPQAGSVPDSQEQQEPVVRPPDEFHGQVVTHVFRPHPSAPPQPIPPGADTEGGSSRRTSSLLAVFLIVLVLLFFCYVSVFGYTWW